MSSWQGTGPSPIVALARPRCFDFRLGSTRSSWSAFGPIRRGSLIDAASSSTTSRSPFPVESSSGRARGLATSGFTACRSSRFGTSCRLDFRRAPGSSPSRVIPIQARRLTVGGCARRQLHRHDSRMSSTRFARHAVLDVVHSVISEAFCFRFHGSSTTGLNSWRRTACIP